MKKSLIKSLGLSSLMLVSFSCGDFLDINQDPNNATDASLEQLLPSTQLSIGSVFGGQHTDGSGSINEDPSIFVQHYYTLSPSRFDIAASDYDANWRDVYREALKDIEEIVAKGTEEERWVHVGIAQVEKAFIFSTFVDLWGDVPYSEALLGQENLGAAFDNGQAVYESLFTLLDEAIANLNKESLLPINDIFFGGDPGSWIKVANSIKLNMFNKIRLVDPARSAAGITALLAEGNIMTANTDDWDFRYGSNTSPENRHPLFIENYVACCNAFPSAYLIYTMNNEEDPRVPYYFYRQTLNNPTGTNVPCDAIDCSPYANNGYYGRGYTSRVQGDDSGIPNDGTIRTTFGVYPAGGLYDIVKRNTQGAVITSRAVSINSNSGAGIQPLMTNFMILFARAEAALTLATADDARDMLEQAIRAQIDKVIAFSTSRDGNALGKAATVLDDLTGDPEELTVQQKIDNYVTSKLEAYDDAATDAERLEVIITEKHKALFCIGWEAYNDYRRTGYPRFFNMQTQDGSLVTYPTTAREAALVPNGEFPRRLLFPALELNSNPNAPAQTTKATPVFWDKN